LKLPGPNVQERRIYTRSRCCTGLSQQIDQDRRSGLRPHDVVRMVTFTGRLGNYVNSSGAVGDNNRALNDLTDVLPAAVGRMTGQRLRQRSRTLAWWTVIHT
jgi:hypothetical protein